MIAGIWYVSNIHVFANATILARRIRMSLVRNSYFTHVILSRLLRDSRKMVA